MSTLAHVMSTLAHEHSVEHTYTHEQLMSTHTFAAHGHTPAADTTSAAHEHINTQQQLMSTTSS